jgi:hypothetical protein
MRQWHSIVQVALVVEEVKSIVAGQKGDDAFIPQPSWACPKIHRVVVYPGPVFCASIFHVLELEDCSGDLTKQPAEDEISIRARRREETTLTSSQYRRTIPWRVCDNDPSSSAMKITSRRCLSAAVLVAMGAPAALGSSYYGGSNAAPAAYGNPSYNSQAQPQDYASPAQSERQPQGDGPPPLPPGWVEYMDASSGMPYYFHEADGITTWDRPVAEEADASKAPEATFEAREESNPEQGQGETPLSFEPASASNPAAGSAAPQEAEQAIKLTPEGNASLEHERRDMGRQTPPEAMEQPQEPPRQQQQQQSGWGMPEDPRRGPRGDEPPLQQQDRPQMPPGAFGGDTPQRPPQQSQQPPMDPSAGRERPPSDARFGGEGRPSVDNRLPSDPRFGGEGRPPVDNRPPEGRGPDPHQPRPEAMQQPSWGARPGTMDRAPEKPPAVPPQGPEQPMGQSPPNDANRFSPPPQQQGGPPSARGPPTPGMPPQSSSSDILQRPPEGGYPPPQQQLQQAPPQQQQQAPPQPNQPGGNYPNQPPYQRNPYIAQQYGQGPPPGGPNSYSQYSQYGQYQGYGRQQPPPNQLIPAATSTAVQGALTNAWQGILGFSNRTKEAVETARTSVVTTAKEATETISTKGGGK